MAEPQEVPAVELALDEMNAIYGGDLPEYLGEHWRGILQPAVFNAWVDGYTTGMRDAGKAVDG